MNAPQSDSIHSVETLHIPPITLLSQDEMLSREKSRSRLNLPNDVRVTYLQLGAGQINDINSEVRMTIESLLNYGDMHIVLGESMLGERLDFTHDRVHLLRDYPNSMYFNGFDYSVQAGGYNSFHEMRNLGIPTLFYPNMKTGMDDQLARCEIAEKENWGIVLENRNQVVINYSIEELLNLRPVAKPQFTSGSVVVAEYIGQ